MRERNRIIKSVSVLAIPIMVLLANAGCTLLSPERYYLFKDTVYDRASKKHPTQVTDQDVIEFSNDVKTVLRARMNLARIVRLFSGTFQVLTAASAAALGVASGSITAISALAASSAVVPELQNIFEAKERAEAYVEGVKLIEAAEVRYLIAVGGKVSDKRLTTAAANFYREVAASLRLVEKALVAQLPTIDELQAATGKLQQVEAVPASMTLTKGQEKEFVVVIGGPVTEAVSGNPQVADVVTDVTKGAAKKVKITGKNLGSTTITFVNDRGGMGTAEVTVTEEVDLVLAGPSQTTVRAGESLTYTFTVRNTSSNTVATDVAVTVALPPGMKVERAGDSDWRCAPARLNEPLTCTMPTLVGGNSAAIAITVKAPSKIGEVHGIASVAAFQPDGDAANNMVKFTTQVTE